MAGRIMVERADPHEATTDNTSERARRRHRRPPTASGPVQRVILVCAAVVFAIFTLFPFYWMAVSAFRDPRAVMTSSSLVPGPLSVESFQTLFETTAFTTYMINSLIVSTGVAVVSVLISAPVAYLLTRWKTRLGSALSVTVLFTYMFPEVLLVIPIFVLMGRLNLDNTLVGLGTGMMATAIPLGIWLMIGFFRNLPVEVEEAGLMDGAGWAGVFRWIVLPISRPGLLTVGVFSFVLAWTDYIFALTLVTDDSRKTLPVGLATLFGKFDANWGVIMAGALLMTLPMLIGLAIVGRYFVSGLTQGATKG